MAEPLATVTVCCATDVGLLRDTNGDVFVVSDIASGAVLAPTEPRTFVDILKQTSNLGVSALTLIRAALGAGGPDNVTVILAQYDRAV